MNFPPETLTISTELVGAGSTTILPTGTYTILQVNMQQSGVASETQLLCGTLIIAKNYAKDLPSIQMSYVCNNTVTLSKTGADSSTAVVVYTTKPLPEIANTSIQNISIPTLDLLGAFMIFYVVIYFTIWLFRKK